MRELHKSQYDVPQFEPSDGQRGLLCSNRTSLRCPSLGFNKPLSKETLNALEELGDVLRGIRKRMISEGYDIVDGKVCKRDT
jgi:hypothetical protein